MADLQNSFSWSPSRARLFETCHRAYYFNHYGMWGGWSVQAPQRARLAYRLKQLTALPMWSGQIVHRAIEQSLASYRRAQIEPEGPRRDGLLEGLSCARLQQRAREMMVEGWRESLGGRWRQDPKNVCNLFEHYYQLPRAEVDPASVRARDRAFACLERFRDGGVWERLTRLGPQRWLSVEQLQQLEVGGIKVWVQLDLALEDEQGRIVLIDWKTGRPADEDREQVAVYALYAVQRWPSVALDALSAELHYLHQGEVVALTLDAAQLAAARERILASAAAMQALLRDPAGNVAVEEDFPLLDPGPICRSCRFRELCER